MIPHPLFAFLCYCAIVIATASPDHRIGKHSRASGADTSNQAVTVYGSVLTAPDVPLDKLDKTQPPEALAQIYDGIITSVGGSYSDPCYKCLGGKWIMFYRGQWIHLSGTGYFSIRWELAYFNQGGMLSMPTFTSLEGKLFHVASGGGHRGDDTRLDNSGSTWLGNPANPSKYIPLQDGVRIPWQMEYYYLDGSVIIHENERIKSAFPADYNIAVTPSTWVAVTSDINRNSSTAGYVRYGLARDITGDDSAPVPQFLTRTATNDSTTVPMDSTKSLVKQIGKSPHA